MNWKIIFNPFEKFGDKQLLSVGLIGFVALNVVCIVFKMNFDGILHLENSDGIVQQIILKNIAIVLSAIILFFILGKIYNRKTRFIDIVNTFLIGIIPTLFILLWNEIPYFKRAQENIGKIVSDQSKMAEHSGDLFILSISAIVALPLIIYIIILLYNGFKTSTNIKSVWKIAVFFVILFILNLITQIYF